MVFGYVPGPGTIVQGVEQLPPRPSSPGMPRRTRCRAEYWSARRSVRAGREPEQRARCGDGRLLESAVADTLVADVPVGVFLSGGVDSTLVTALVSAISPSRPRLSPSGTTWERVRARAGPQHGRTLGTEHHEVVLVRPTSAGAYPACSARSTSPWPTRPSFRCMHSELARRHVTVAVSGEGADELFGGYPRYRWLIRRARSTACCRSDTPPWARGCCIVYRSSGRERGGLRRSWPRRRTLERHSTGSPPAAALADRRFTARGSHVRLIPMLALASLAPYVEASEGDSARMRSCSWTSGIGCPTTCCSRSIAQACSTRRRSEPRTSHGSSPSSRIASGRDASCREWQAAAAKTLAGRLPQEVTRRPKTAFRVPGQNGCAAPSSRSSTTCWPLRS